MIRFRFPYGDKPKTVPEIGTVKGAKQEGAMQVVRRQVREGFVFEAPNDVEHPQILIVVPDAGLPLMPVVKNIIDGLDSMNVIHDDRQVFEIQARVGGTEDETIVEVTYLEPCSRQEEGCSDKCDSKRKAYGCTLLIAAHALTTAFPATTVPLVSPSGEYVKRDAEAYVNDLRADVPDVVWEEGDTDELRRLVGSSTPLRVRVHLETPGFADIDNAAARLIHLMHVIVHDSDDVTAQQVWEMSPAVEDLIREVDILRSESTASCRLATITVEEAYTPTDNPVADTSFIEMTTPLS